MNPHFLPIAAAVVLLAPAHAQLAGTYEPFTYQTNAESWFVYDYADDNYYFPEWDLAGDGLNPDIYFTFLGSNALEFSADETSSGGAFAGDLAAAGVDAISCNVFVEDASSFDFGAFFLFSAATNRYYYSEYFDPDEDGWSFAYASLTQEDWYLFEAGKYVPVALTPQILGEITGVGVTFYPLEVPTGDGKAVGIDDFTFYGALVLPQVSTSTGGGSFRLSFERRPGIGYSIRSAPDLATWTLVPGAELITGTSPYMMTKPLVPRSLFYKVGIEDFLTPVPRVPAL